MIPAILFSAILLELLIVSWVDVKTEKISNRWILLNVLLSLVFHIVFRSLYPLTFEVLIFPLGFLVVGFMLYLLNVMGAGDSKYLASLFLLIPLEFQMPFFERLVGCTVVMGITLISVRTYKNAGVIRAYLVNHHWEGLRKIFRSRFSYAPVILLAWLFTGVTLWK